MSLIVSDLSCDVTFVAVITTVTSLGRDGCDNGIFHNVTT